MRRIVIFALLICFISSVTAGELINDSKKMVIQAGMGAVTDIYIERIPAQSEESFKIGMPFNIEDEYIQYRDAMTSSHIFGAGSGRIIAHWSYLTNVDFKMKLHVQPLMPVDKTQKVILNNGKEGLTYSLAFSSHLSFKNKNGLIDEYDSYVVYHGDTGLLAVWDKNTATEYPSVDGYVRLSDVFDGSPDQNGGSSFSSSLWDGFAGSAYGDILFGFTKESSDTIINNPEKVPVGEYSATVTIEIVTDGGVV